MSKKLIAVDIGHGRNTYPPSKGYAGFAEFTFNNAVGIILKQLLELNGFDVLLTQPINGLDVSLNERTRIANMRKADLLISLHANYNDNKSANGFDVFYWKGNAEGQKFANLWFNNAKSIMRNKARYIYASELGKWYNFHIVRETKMTALLVEHAFYSNTHERALLQDADFQRRCAIVSAKSICELYGVKFKEKEEIKVEKNPIKKIINKDVHIYKKGETFWSLSKKYKINLKDMTDWNKHLNYLTLQEGDRINLKKPIDFLYHVVVKGDTYWSLSRKYNVSVQSLEDLNSQEAKEIKIGSKLKIKKI